MSSNSGSEGTTSHGESSETIEIKIRTLDSATHSLRVNKDIPIPALKEQVQALVGVPASNQRLIWRGKVLKDDQLLSTYEIGDGHTLHLVARTQSPTSESQGREQASTQNQTGDPSQQARVTQTHSLLVGLNVPDGGFPDLNRIVSAVLGSVGNLQGANVPPGTNAPGTGTQADAQQGSQANSQRVGVIPIGISQVSSDALTTLSLYLTRLEQLFASTGIGTASSQPANLPLNRPVMTPATLGGILRRVQTLFNTHGSVILNGLAGQLENEPSLTDVNARGEVQAAALWSGTILQQLGALLMELGRTTSALHMGNSPAEALVNSGPAVYISPSGPNPIMVQPTQPLPALPTRMPLLPNGFPGLSSSRSLNIHIHTSDVGLTPTTNVPPSDIPASAGSQVPTSATAGQENGGTGLDSNSQAVPSAVLQETIMVIQENDGRVVSSRSRNLSPGQADTTTEGTAGANPNGTTEQIASQVAQAFNQLFPGGRQQSPFNMGSNPFSSSVNTGSNPFSSATNSASNPFSSILGSTIGQLQGTQFNSQPTQQPVLSTQVPATLAPTTQTAVNSPAPTVESQTAATQSQSQPTSDSMPGTSSSDSNKHQGHKDNAPEPNVPAGLGLGGLRPLMPRRRTQENPSESSASRQTPRTTMQRAPAPAQNAPAGGANALANIMGQLMRSPAMESIAQQFATLGEGARNTEVPRTAVANAQMPAAVDSAVEKLEDGDSEATDVISSVVKAAIESAGLSLSETEALELIHEVAGTDGLADEYIAMLLQDLSSRQ